MDYTIVGTPVNVAARLQSACAPNKILVSSNTQALIADTFQLVSRGALSLKGIGEEVEAFEVRVVINAKSTPGSSIDVKLAALQEQLEQIDLDKLGEEEKQQLLRTMSKLLRGQA